VLRFRPIARWRAALAAATIATGWTTGPATAGGPLEIAASVAWAGVARPGLWTEVEIRVVSERGGVVSLEAGLGPIPTRTSGPVEAGLPSRFRLPVWLAPEAADDALTVTASGPTGHREQLSLPLDWIPPGTLVVALASDLQLEPGVAAGLAVGRSIRRVEASATSLPTYPRVFELADVLALDPRTLGTLTPTQVAAFEHHLEACGKTVVVGAPAAAIRRGLDRAGCRGRAFASVGDRSAMVAALTGLLATDLPLLPSARELEETFAEERWSTIDTTLLGFFGLYAAILVAGGAALPRPWQLITLSLLGAALLAAVLGSLPIEASTQFWVEQTTSLPDQQTRTARFASLIRVTTSAPKDVVLRVQRASGLPSPLPGTRLLSFEVHPPEGGDAPSAELGITLRGTLLGSNTLRTEGSLSWTSALLLAGNTETPRVENAASHRSEQATLVWKGEAYRVPALDPGESYSPALSKSEPIPTLELPRWLVGQRRSATAPRLIIAGVPEVLTSQRSATGATPTDGDASVGWTTIRWAAQ
jgi:hypothetical protein